MSTEYVAGMGLLLDTALESSSDVFTDSWHNLAKSAAGTFGLRNSSSGLQLAKDGLAEGVRQLNSLGTFVFTTEDSVDLPLVADTAEYSVGSSVFSVQEIVLLDENDEQIRYLESMPYQQSLAAYLPRSTRGIPEAWTARNIQGDATVTLLWTPDAAAIGVAPTARVLFRKRIARPENDNTGVLGPAELELPLKDYARYYISADRKGASHPDTRAWFAKFRWDVGNIRTMGSQQADTHVRMQVLLKRR